MTANYEGSRGRGDSHRHNRTQRISTRLIAWTATAFQKSLNPCARWLWVLALAAVLSAMPAAQAETEGCCAFGRRGGQQQLHPVTFCLGTPGVRVGGGALLQSVAEGMAAEAPLLAVEPGWSFVGWDNGFQHVAGPTVVRAVYSFAYRLSAGWNLVSVNLDLDGASRALLQDKGAIALDAGSKAYAVNGNLAATQACWIYCQGDEEFTLSGTGPDDFGFEASLKPGWNFAGPLYGLSLTDGAIAWGWDGRNYRPAEDLLAGRGYWIHLPDGNVAPPRDVYLIVDLSEGPEATSYPVSALAATPAGGWTDEHKTTKLVLRRIPAGTFMMGSPENELGRWYDETQHQVTLTKDFYAGVFEVTQKQWNLVMGNWPSYFKNETCRESRPVEQVRYDDIRGSSAGSGWPANNAVDGDSFLGRLRAKTNLTFDLPTEAQWEYACRAGTMTALNSGKNLTGRYECPNMAEVGRYRYNGGSDSSSGCDTSCGSAKVGSHPPNQWGLYDMHGNVYEWCLDWYPENPGSSAQTDPRGAAGGTYRVGCGGSWNNSAWDCRSAKRDEFWPSIWGSNLGFRLVITVP